MPAAARTNLYEEDIFANLFIHGEHIARSIYLGEDVYSEGSVYVV